jgi:hypothetical protein
MYGDDPRRADRIRRAARVTGNWVAHALAASAAMWVVIPPEAYEAMAAGVFGSRRGAGDPHPERIWREVDRLLAEIDQWEAGARAATEQADRDR